MQLAPSISVAYTTGAKYLGISDTGMIIPNSAALYEVGPQIETGRAHEAMDILEACLAAWGVAWSSLDISNQTRMPFVDALGYPQTRNLSNVHPWGGACLL
jgi:hypothetical protein